MFKVLTLLLLLASISLLAVSQLYEDAYWDGPRTLRGSQGMFSIGTSPGPAFIVEVYFTASSPIRLLILAWPANATVSISYYNGTFWLQGVTVILQRGPLTQDHELAPIPGGMNWEAGIYATVPGETSVMLTVRKETGGVNRGLALGGMVLMGATAVLVTIFWPKKDSGQVPKEPGR